MNIIIENKRIITFCTKYPNFNVEDTLLSFIGFVENTCDKTVPSLDSNLATQLLLNIKSLQNQVLHMESTINAKQNEYINKFADFRKDYIQDITNILSINNSDKTIPAMKEYNEIFINKLTLLFKEIIPKNQESQTKEIENFIQQLFLNINSKYNIEGIFNTIEQKFSLILTQSENKTAEVLNSINSKKTEDHELKSNLNELLNKLHNCNQKGKISEDLVLCNLHELYSNAEILHVRATPHTGDFVLKRVNKPDILIENKNYDKTVYTDEVEKFINDINTQNVSGIMLSQKTKIVHRENYQIEIHNGNVAIYVHEVNYDPVKIKIAVDIIDTLKLRIEKQQVENGDSINIDKESLEKINKEYQLWNSKKSKHINTIKETYDTLVKSAEEMEMNELTELLEHNGLFTNVKKWICDRCGSVWKSQKGLDTHYRKCSTLKKENKCGYCEHIAKTPKGLLSHCKKMHNLDCSDSDYSDD